MKRRAASGYRRDGARLRGLARSQGGATIVEFALIAPPLLILLLGIMEAGRALWTQNALNYAVEQAARCASIDANNCGTATQVAAYAANVAGADFGATAFAVSTSACGHVVDASYPLTLHIPFVGTALTLTAHSCFP
jgi:Flp pilus assembly protein TadG